MILDNKKSHGGVEYGPLVLAFMLLALVSMISALWILREKPPEKRVLEIPWWKKPLVERILDSAGKPISGASVRVYVRNMAQGEVSPLLGAKRRPIVLSTDMSG